jgi:hypothetical protein
LLRWKEAEGVRIIRTITVLGLLTLGLVAAHPAAWAGVPVASTSSIWVEPDTSEVGDTVDVYVVIRDVYGEPIADLACDFITDRPDTDVVIGSPDVTDINGAAQARVTRSGNFYPPVAHLSHVTVDCEGVIIGPVTVAWMCMSGVGDGRAGVMALYGNAPNPFRGATDIEFATPGRARVSLAVFDVAGRKVRTLADGVVEPGNHSVRWDGRSDSGSLAPSGVYYVQMAAPGFEKTASMILLR